MDACPAWWERRMTWAIYALSWFTPQNGFWHGRFIIFNSLVTIKRDPEKEACKPQDALESKFCPPGDRHTNGKDKINQHPDWYKFEQQSSTTCGAIDDRRISLKAIDERVFTKFCDKKCRIYKFAQQKCRIYPFSRQKCRIHTFLCQKSLVP